jgi:hypothetical protein
MSHFSAAQWFEFAGHMLSSEQRVLMQRHLEEGCDECRNLSVLWSEVLDISRRESSYRAQETAVESAKAIFVPEESWKWFRQIAQVAELILDSIRQPTPAAIRGSTASSRQVLHKATPFMVDLRVEYDPARKWLRLIGQVLNSAEPAKNVLDVDVFLLKGDHLATRTTANASGEFALEFQDEEGLQLFIDIRGQKVIEIRLPTSLEGDGRGMAAGAE